MGTSPVKLHSSAPPGFCNFSKPRQVARQVTRQFAKRECNTLQPICNLSRNSIATQVANKTARCNTSFRARFYFLQRLQIFAKCVFCKHYKFQLGIATCNISPATCNGFLFSVLQSCWFHGPSTSAASSVVF